MPRMFCEFIRMHQRQQGLVGSPKDLHKDTFHPTMKAWLFLDNVTTEKVPFITPQGSHRLNAKKLLWEYRESLRRSGRSDEARGSFRMQEGQLGTLGYHEAVALRVLPTPWSLPTVGFHRRSDAQSNQSRLAIWATSRINPFTPFTGLDSRRFDRLRENIYARVIDRHRTKASSKKRNGATKLIDNFNARTPSS